MSFFKLCLALVCYCLLMVIEVQCTVSPDSDRQWYAQKLMFNETGVFPSNRVHVLRLSPNEDLLECLYRYAQVLNIRAASILSTVGSLQTTNIRYANQEGGQSLTGHFEIVSLVGNIELDSDNQGSGHVHISVSNESGETIGGHLLNGNIIYTTAEITLLEIVGAEFVRQLDDADSGGSGYYELRVLREEN